MHKMACEMQGQEILAGSPFLLVLNKMKSLGLGDMTNVLVILYTFCILCRIKCPIKTVQRYKKNENWKRCLTISLKSGRILKLTQKDEPTKYSQKTLKNPEKDLKKVLTKRMRCGIIERSARESGWLKWSLKIEQQERSTKRKAWNGSRKFLQMRILLNKK